MSVLINKCDFSPTKFFCFLHQNGWSLIAEAIGDGLFVMTHPKYPNRQLVFPVSDRAPDRDESIFRAIETLASLSEVPVETVLHDLFHAKTNMHRKGHVPMHVASDVFNWED